MEVVVEVLSRGLHDKRKRARSRDKLKLALEELRGKHTSRLRHIVHIASCRNQFGTQISLMGLLSTLKLYDAIYSIRAGLSEEGFTFTRLGKDMPVVSIIF